jgi:dethiobiotin synthetase
VAMKLRVLVVACNRLGCLNHAALTVQSVIGHRLRCAGLVLNNAQGTGDIATMSNADILKKIIDVPVLGELGESLTEVPAEWRFILDSTINS